MNRTTFLITALTAGAFAPAWGATFESAPLLPDEGVDVLNRTVTREVLDRDLFSSPYATVVVGHVDIYDRFPYLESRWFQVVSDPGWNRLLYGEVGGDLGAHDGQQTAWGQMNEPRGLSVDEFGRVYVADTGNHRVLAFDTWTEFDRIQLKPVFAIEGLARPFDVAYSDAGTPFDRSDDRLYVADTGRSRVAAYDLTENDATFRSAVGELGSGANKFAGPMALTVGRTDGVHTDDVYVADAHNARIVRLEDDGARLRWSDESVVAAGTVTALDTDHWGHVYATSPSAKSVLKFNASLESLDALQGGLDHPRAFHVPFANRTDHRTGEVSRTGESSAILVEEWSGEKGLSLVKLGTDIREMDVHADRDVVAEAHLTHRSSVSAEILDRAGRTVHTANLGVFEAGHVSLELNAADLATLPEGDYTFRVNANEGSSSASAEANFAWNGTSLALPTVAALEGALPNPFRGETAVRFAIPASGASSHSIDVFDIAGRLVRTLSDGAISSGVHSVTWDGRDSSGSRVAAGIYFSRLLVNGEEVQTRKMVHLR